ncbi:di-heme-cytochrome C peroxidase [Magnetospirillum moscoviense]|uniref:Cytochrome c domain-containing protein n=1 Tax=Magnetospirillum moscoviense TaxID=1437059 RepID=A0A178MGS6_9PROT|nr:di-heme-cytochrome C peroxidase [Magnetospirillum moscoviense]OAN47866.1 hypothetical protein A6A05_03305 [Magnetospirillum moscoviense]
MIAIGGLMMGCAPEPAVQESKPVPKQLPAPPWVLKTTPTEYNVMKVNQGWNDDEADWYYNLSQGSRIAHYDLVVNLEQPKSFDLFLADGLARYGYLPAISAKWNPDSLPIGFAKDQPNQFKQAWFGMTCAACHTNRIQYQGREIQIDGAPALADLGGFLRDLQAALAETATDSGKFDRMAFRMLGANASNRSKQALKARLNDNAGRVAAILNNSTSDSWGHARTDAFGMIFNRVTGIDLGYTENEKAADAPVSYPHLWDTGRFNWVQWNAAVPNRTSFEKLGRNAGEVLGVFGDAALKKPRPLHEFYDSTVRVRNLGAMEVLVEKLTAPRWRDAIGPIDNKMASAGGTIYAEKCLSCHALINNLKAPIEVVTIPMDQVGTDPTMNHNATRMVQTRQLAGTKMLAGDKLQPTDLGINLLANAVTGSILGKIARPETDPLSPLPTGWSAPKAQTKPPAGPSFAVATVYKARPLNGIWATAPYLHNGSVPSLYELLKPPAERIKAFKVGSTAFDAKNVGFATDSGPTTFETAKPANSNAGHAYGTDLTDQQRWELIEFIKSL